MNPFVYQALLSLYSYKKELKYVFFSFLLVLLLPVLAIILLTQTGLEVVSDHLATFDAKTQKVQLFYPNGTFFKAVDANVTWPTHGVITLEFGEADFPYQPFHSGIDIAGKRGDPITPFMPGKVIYAGQIFWGFGKHVIVDHGDNITSVYGHLDKIMVKKDDEVKPGKVIGLEGNTGWSTGPHLHFQVNVFGIPVNPRVFLGT